MNKKNLIMIIPAILMVLAVGFGWYHLRWFGRYWLIIGMAIVTLIVSAVYSGAVRNALGVYIGQFLSNNNWRCGTLAIITLIFTVSAILAGFGQPILVDAAKQTKSALAEQADKHPAVVAQIKRLWSGTNSVGAVATTAPTSASEKKHSSWWHWVWAILLWIATIIYFPISRRDELARALTKALEKKKRRDLIKNQPSIGTAPASGEAPAGGSGLFAKGSFLWHLFIDSLGEFVPALLSKIVKKIK